MRYRCLLAEEAHFPVRMMCHRLQVSRSGFYAWRKRPESKRRRQDRKLVVEIQAVHEENRRVYGSPRIHAELRARGHRAGHNRVARLMRENGIQARGKRRFSQTTDSHHRLPVAPNVLGRDFVCDRPNQKWAGDITYLWTREGWLYLAVLLDLYSRHVVGWAASSRIDGSLTLRALKMAICARSPVAGLLHHSDQGKQYACQVYRGILKGHGIQCSMSRKGDCWDNAMVESFIGTLKTEIAHHADWRNRLEAVSDLFKYLEVFYNRKRRHSALGFLSPAEYEKRALAQEDSPKLSVHKIG